MNRKTIGLAMCGSFCTFARVLDAFSALDREQYDLVPIQSQAAYSTDTRFGAAASSVGPSGRSSGAARMRSGARRAGIGRMSSSAPRTQAGSVGAVSGQPGTPQVRTAKPHACSCRARQLCRRSPPSKTAVLVKTIPSFAPFYAGRRKKAPARRQGQRRI